VNSIAESFRFLFSDLTGEDNGPLPAVPDGVPEALRPAVADAIAELNAYQGPSYAQLYAHRLNRFARRRDVDAELLGLIARQMARRMCYDDPIGIAQRHLAAVRCGAASEARHRFRLEELVGALPGKLGRPLLLGCAQVGWLHLPISLRFNGCGLWGRQRLRLQAGLRRWRRFSERYASERAWVERWLHMIDRSLTKAPAAAMAIAETATMVGGSGETYRRGLADWHLLIDGVVKPVLDGAMPLADLAGAVAEITALSREGSSERVAETVGRLRKEAGHGT